MPLIELKSPFVAFKDCRSTARVAALASAGTAAVCGQLEDGLPAAPINAISHMVYGEESFRQTEPSLKYTGTGLMVHDSAVRNWSVLHEVFFGRAKEEGNAAVSVAGGLLVSFLAYLVDYHLVPERLKPGFERHLMPRSLLAIYLVLGLALGLAGLRRK